MPESGRRTVLGLLALGAAAALTATMASPAVAELGRQKLRPATTRTHAAVAPPRTVIAVTGVNGSLYAKNSTEPTYRALGGTLTDAPAVAYSTATNRSYYVVKGTTNALYVRTDTTPFSLLVPSVCRFAPAVGISGDQLTAACIGTNYALYYGTTTLRGPGNPVIPRMIYQGGIAVRGPAIFYVGTATPATPAFAVVNIHDPAVGPNVSVRAATEPVRVYAEVPESCADQLDLVAASSPDDSAYFFGCRNGDPSADSTDALYYEWHGADPGATAETDGIMRGRVGIAAATDRSSAVFYVTGADGHVYSKQVVTGSSTGEPFVFVGGRARPGVAAATIG